MYESFFGLRDKPFNMTPDPRYLYLSDSHEEALAALLYGIRERKGLITLTGAAGVGKTTILYSFLEQVRDRIEVAFFPGGFSCGRIDFLKELCRLFGLRGDIDSQFDLTREIEGFLQEKAGAGKNIVLLADEAQDLSLEELNHFRFLNNLETPDVKFLQIILSGTGEFDRKLRDPKVLSLRQRVAVRCVINPLDPGSSVAYIHHRVGVAGGAAENLFTPGAMWRVVNYARGIPRMINVVCDNALVIAYALKRPAVEEAHVREALESLEGDAAARESAGFVSREDAEAFCLELRKRPRREASGASSGRGDGTPQTGRKTRPSGFEEEPGVPQAMDAGAERMSPLSSSLSGGEPGRGQDLLEGSPARVSAAAENRQPGWETPCEGSPACVSAAAENRRPGREDLLEGSPARVSAAAGRRGGRSLGVAGLLLAGAVIGALGSFFWSGSRDAGERRVAAPVETGITQPRADVGAELPGPDAAVPAEPSRAGLPLSERGRDKPSERQARAEAPWQERVEKRLVVAAGQGIAAILSEHYGRLDPGIYAEVRKRNPHVRDWNRLAPATELLLPPADAAAGEGSLPGDMVTVQAVTFFSEGQAARVTASFCAGDLRNVFVVRGRVEGEGGREWICCYAGLFAGVEEALVWRDRVRQWGFPDAFVTRLSAERLSESLQQCEGPVSGHSGAPG